MHRTIFFFFKSCRATDTWAGVSLVFFDISMGIRWSFPRHCRVLYLEREIFMNPIIAQISSSVGLLFMLFLFI
ncbi:hypothetical protein [Methanobrevibacter sp.]|uniref:hypothetical protein n=1 Tax=Methanobrevibacter sp. TaxID=66852 RepID=UPI0038641BC8